MAAKTPNYRGEWKSVTPSYGATTTADTWTAIAGSLELGPGSWEIGYDVTLGMSDAVANQLISGNVAIYNGSIVLSETIGYASKSAIPSVTYNVSMPMSRRTKVDITSTTTYSLRIRCSKSSAEGQATLLGSDVTGSLTNPDNSPILWARRL